MICGGFNNDIFDIYLYSLANECYSFTAKKATLITYMSVERMDAASIVLNDNTLWVTGGVNPVRLASTEYVKETGTMPGPDMPMALVNHAMVAINSTCSMVIGGESNDLVSSASTFFYDRNEDEWITGPSLMQAREWHAAGIVTDEVTDEHIVAVTGGRGYSDSSYLDSTEILQDGEWIQGKINDTIRYLLENLLVAKYNYNMSWY